MEYVDRGGCDFFGFNNRGAHVAIEAKQCQDDRKSLPLWKDGEGFGVKVHQMQHLREVAKAGGFGLIVWKQGEQVTILDTMNLGMDVLSINTAGCWWKPIGELAQWLEDWLTDS